jgi:hypothetical protein
MTLAVYESGRGVVAAIVGGGSVWVYFAQREWSQYLHNWLLFMLTGLTLIGHRHRQGEAITGGGRIDAHGGCSAGFTA